MGYDLTALAGPAPVMAGLAVTIPGARVVPLAQGIGLMPTTGDLIDTVTGGAAAWIDGFRLLPTLLADRIAEVSRSGPIAYLEAEFFGGAGSQDVRVWRDGAVVLDRHDPVGRLSDPTPISEALHILGVRAAQGDEFDAVGLLRHRRTEDWLDEPSP